MREAWNLARNRTGRLAAALALLVAGCGRDDNPGSVDTEDGATEITRNFTTTASDSGEVRYVFHARVARGYPDEKTRAENIRVEFYEAGKVVSVLTARQGTLGGGRLTATGNVVVETVEGARLETESLFWDREIKKIRSEEVVRITRRGDPEVLTGRGLTTDPNLDLVDIGSPNLTGPVDAERR